MKTFKRFWAFLLSAILLVSSVPVFTLTAAAADSLSSLQAAASAYETKMSNINNVDFYTGTKRAYDAYVVVNRYIDAINCGEAEVDVTGAVEELNNATTAMGSWSFKTANAHASFLKDDSYLTDEHYSQIYKNIIWGEALQTNCGDSTETGWDGNSVFGEEETLYSASLGRKTSIRPVLYHPSVVMLYDGVTTPSTAVLFRSRRYRGGTGNAQVSDYAVYINSNAQGLYLNHFWYGADVNPNFQYTYFYNVNKSKSNKNGLISHLNSFEDVYNYATHSGIGSTKNYFYANILYFDGSFTNDSPYTRKITGVEWGFKYGNDDNSSDKHTQTATQNNDHPIYAINYAAIRSALGNDTKSIARNVSSYKEGGLSTFFQGCDEATGFDPQNNYTWNSSSVAANIEDCATKIGNAISHINADKAADIYTGLRNEMLNSHDGHNSAKEDYHSATGYTTSSKATYDTKYEAAMAEMAALVNSPYKSALGSVLTELQNAHHNTLVQRADFSELISAYNTQTAYSNSADMANYTSYSADKFREAIDTTHTPYSHYTTAQMADTPISTQSDINAEKTAINNASSLLDVTKSLTTLETAYNRADATLLAMDGETVDYTKDQLEELINAVDLSQNYLSATAAQKREFGTRSHGGEIDGVVETINDVCDDFENASTIDLSALNAIVATAENIDSDVYNYTPAELNAQLRTVKRMVYASPLTYTSPSGSTATITAAKSGVDMNVVDTAASLLLSSLNSHIREYTVEIVQGETSAVNGVTFNGGSYSYDKANDRYTASYGTTVTFRSDSDEAAWFMEYDSQTTQRDAQYQAYGSAYTAKVFGNMYIYCKTPDDGNKLTVKREYSDSESTPVQFIDYVSGEYILPNAPVIPYYVFDGYYLDGNKVTGSITVNGETSLVAKYTADPSKPNYTAAEEGGSSVTAQYNEEVSFTGANDTYAWLELESDSTYRPFYIGKDVTFLATESTTLKPVTQAEFTAAKYSLPAINLRKNGAISTTSEGQTKVSFTGQYVTDGSKQLLEYGVLVGKAKDGGSITNDDVVLENAGSTDNYILLRAKSTTSVGANQFSISVNNMSGTFLYRGYVIYQDSTGVHNAYTDVYSDTF